MPDNELSKEDHIPNGSNGELKSSSGKTKFRLI